MKKIFSIVLFFFLCPILVFSQEVKIISSSPASLTFEYIPAIIDTLVISEGNNHFVKLIINGTYSEFDESTSKYILPKKEVNVGVPSEFGNTISVLNAEFDYLGEILVPTELTDNDMKAYNGQSFWNIDEFRSPAMFGEYGLTRNLPVQSIQLSPLEYDEASNRIKVYKRIVVRVNFAPVKTAGVGSIVDARIGGAVLNYDVCKNWGITQPRLRKTENSVLANGTWYRFECTQEGIYKIDRAMLSQLGINADNVNPQTIQIFNNGGYQLPESISTPQPEDLREIAVYVSGEADQSFDANDYILFYGRSTNFWEYSATTKKMKRNKNEFSKHNYFWITSGQASGKRVTATNSLTEPNAVDQTTSAGYATIEQEIYNLGETGRDILGDKLTPTSPEKTYLTKLDGFLPDQPIKYSFRLVNTGSSTVPLTISETGTSVYSATLARVYGEYTIGVEHAATASYTGSLTDNRSNLKVRINSSGSTVEVYLDYIELEYTKELRAIGDSLIFYSPLTNDAVRYNLNNFSSSSMMLFDITDYQNVSLIQGASISGGNCSFVSQGSVSQIRKYYGVTSSSYLTPSNIAQMTNSNLKGSQNTADYIIVTHPQFLSQAEELANYRSSSANPLSTVVVNVENIYNEFSGGSLDPGAIRNFLRYAYENWNPKPFYVLLLGDGSYDFYGVLGDEHNFIPAYETSYSLHEINSYASDDFYVRISGDDLKADYAIGRINVQTTQEAETVINKIKQYEQDPERTLWKNTITLVADDGPTTQRDDGNLHTKQSEDLANIIIPDSFIENKIYLAAYPTVITGSGRRKPDVNRAIIDAVNQGTLMLNFIGHGDPERWAHENVFTTDASIPQLQNDKYFFLTAATCDYGRYDRFESQSATEVMLLMDNGIIGALTAIRAVYSNLNAALNQAFYTNLFDNPLNKHYCIGDAYFLTKQTKTGDNDEKFHLFGDPTLRLNAPLMPVTIDSVNSLSLENEVQISALSEVTVKGKVLDDSGNPANFSGESIITVFDSDKIIQLPEMNYQMEVQGGIIFKGRATVENGEYRIGFVVPKDISYADDNGRILAYIYNDEKDGLGFTRNIVVGGTDENVEDDGRGPEVEIFYDDYNFENSYVVNPSFTLLVKLSDETGLNTTGTGVGHRLEGILNDDAEHPIDFSSYFVGDVDAGGKSGKVEYRFTNLVPGEYSIKIKAWDVFNNQSVAQSYFSVVNAEGLVVENVVNYPNPFRNNTTFTFQHNLSASVNVKIKVYTIAGRMVREIEAINIFEKFVRIDWDGRDEDGSLLANGTYLYKVNVETVDGEYNKNIIGKLSIIR